MYDMYSRGRMVVLLTASAAMIAAMVGCKKAPAAEIPLREIEADYNIKIVEVPVERDVSCYVMIVGYSYEHRKMDCVYTPGRPTTRPREERSKASPEEPER